MVVKGKMACIGSTGIESNTIGIQNGLLSFITRITRLQVNIIASPDSVLEGPVPKVGYCPDKRSNQNHPNYHFSKFLQLDSQCHILADSWLMCQRFHKIVNGGGKQLVSN